MLVSGIVGHSSAIIPTQLSCKMMKASDEFDSAKQAGQALGACPIRWHTQGSFLFQFALLFAPPHQYSINIAHTAVHLNAES